MRDLMYVCTNCGKTLEAQPKELPFYCEYCGEKMYTVTVWSYSFSFRNGSAVPAEEARFLDELSTEIEEITNWTRWDPKKFDWKQYSWLIASTGWKHFDVWWDPELFYWDEQSCISLISYQSKHFTKWWNPNKFVWTKRTSLCLTTTCCEYIEKWFCDKWCYECLENVENPEFYDKYFHVWWNPEKIHPEYIDIHHFLEYCGNHINTWLPVLATKLSDHPVIQSILNLDPKILEDCVVRNILQE